MQACAESPLLEAKNSWHWADLNLAYRRTPPAITAYIEKGRPVVKSNTRDGSQTPCDSGKESHCRLALVRWSTPDSKPCLSHFGAWIYSILLGLSSHCLNQLAQIPSRSHWAMTPDSLHFGAWVLLARKPTLPISRLFSGAILGGNSNLNARESARCPAELRLNPSFLGARWWRVLGVSVRASCKLDI